MSTAAAAQPFVEVPAHTLDSLFAEAELRDLIPAFAPNKKPIIINQPKSAFEPAHWSFEQAKPALDIAGDLLPPELAERRALIMRNPMPGNEFSTCRTLICAYQMIRPGEVARTHRHTAHAVRVVIDCEDGYSTLNGERTPMQTGDVLLTPNGEWHAHGHDGDKPAYWLDCLDLPLGYLLEPMYNHAYPGDHQPITSTVEQSPHRFSRDDIRRGLDAEKPDTEGFHGPRIILPTPTLPPIGLAVERLASGQRTRGHRSYANRLFYVMEGQGVSKIEDRSFGWSRGDLVVAPTGHRIEHIAGEDSVLFELNDEPLMRWVRYYQFEAAD
jgi:gentisate 1,2-dioxygenase